MQNFLFSSLGILTLNFIDISLANFTYLFAKDEFFGNCILASENNVLIFSRASFLANSLLFTGNNCFHDLKNFIYSLILVIYMIRVIQNSNGSIKNVDLNKHSLSGLSWINVFNPSSSELSLLERKLGIPVSTLKHFLDNKEIPRIETYKQYIVIILKFLVEKKVRTFGIVRYKNYLLTVCCENANIKIEKEFLSKDLNYLLKNILNILIKSFSSKLNSLEEEINYIEDTIFDEKKQKDPKKIFHLKKELMYMKKGLNADKEVISKLDNVEDINIELNQLIDTENTLTYRMTEVMNMYMTFVSNRMNEIMKSFTVIASLILLPSLVAGIYGMNLKLPLTNTNFGFYIVIGVMLFLMALMIIYFKLKKWV